MLCNVNALPTYQAVVAPEFEQLEAKDIMIDDDEESLELFPSISSMNQLASE